MKEFEQIVREAVAAASGVPPAEIGPLTIPPDPSLGDIAYGCFPLAKRLKKAPPAIAADLAARLTPPAGVFREWKPAGPYINFRVEPAAIARLVLDRVRREGEAYGRSTEGEGRVVVVDYSSPNLAKPFGIGHLRSTVIGRALVRIFQALGYKTVGVNHLGDWGTQFGLMAVAWQRWGSEDELARRPIEHLYELYQRIHREEAAAGGGEDEEASNPVRNEARAFFRRMEEGDAEALRLHGRFRDLSLQEFHRIYDLLCVSFDSWAGESFYNDKMAATLDRLDRKGLLTESQGARVVDFRRHGVDLDPPLIVVKSDGSTTYATRDICAAEYRAQTYGAHRIVYVVGHPQKLHFQQVFATLDLMGYEWAKRCVHVDFGHILGMSTRRGTLVFLNDVLDEAIEKARTIIAEKNPDLDEKDRVARAVGVGAVVFNDLKNGRRKDIQFDWGRVLSFEGETGPYLQNAHVRLCGIIRKWEAAGGGEPADPDVAKLGEPATVALLKLASRFPEAIAEAAEAFEPSVISRYLLDLAGAFHSWYHDHPVIGAPDEATRNARTAWVYALRRILAHGLRILGVEPIDRM